jgi:hypothetical protein
MAELTLPRWIITNKTMPGGWRTAPKPVLVAPIEHPPDEYLSGSGFRILTRREKGYEPATQIGVFENWEYRFWAADLYTGGSVATECRSCGHEKGRTRAARKTHHAMGGCAKRLVAAYDLLLRDKKCVICDSVTGQKHWGVPLCCSACQQAWCEVEAQPKALTAALQLVGDEGWT